MFTCFVCNSHLTTSDKFAAHLMLHSDKVRAGDIKCGYANCNQSFDRMGSFTRHVKGHERKHKLSSNVIVSSNANTIVPVNSCSSENILDDLSSIEIESLAPSLSIEDYDLSLTDSVLGFLGRLHRIESLPRSHVQLIVEEVIALTSGPHLKLLEDQTLGVLKTLDPNVHDLVQNYFQCYRNMFAGLETEHQRTKVYSESGAFIAPIAYTIGSALIAVGHSKRTRMETVNLSGQFIPMRKTLKGFLELPGVFKAITSYMEKLEVSDGAVLENLVQGSVWKDIRKNNPGKTLIPISLYFDDFDPNDTVSPHSCKIGGMYYTIPSIPPEFRSTLDCIFVAALIYAQDKAFGVKEAFSLVLEEIDFLEKSGITLVVNDNEVIQVYFILCVFLGDNLGVHQLLGFVGGFNANYYCRRCKVYKKDAQKMTTLNPRLFRTRANYERDVKINDVSSTGIDSICEWNRFKAYHCIDMVCYDLMHDLEEGAWDYDMCLIIDKFIRRKRFTLPELNNRILGFDFGPCEARNRPGDITQEHLNNRKFKFTGAAKLCFVRYFGIIMGDFVRDEDEKLWRFYQVIHEIVMYFTAPVFAVDSGSIMEALITEHHVLYLELFPGETLKPKHHNMLHFLETCLKFGPLKHLACWRFEGKHRPLQRVARSQNNYINLPKTMSIKHQLKFCELLLSQKGFCQRLLCSSVTSVSTKTLQGSKNFISLLPSEYQDKALTVKWVEISGTSYKINMSLVFKLGFEYPQFGKIKHIIYDDKKKKVTYVMKAFDTVTFSNRFLSYEVKPSEEWIVMAHESLVSYTPTVDRKGPDGRTYVTFRYKL